MHKHRKIVAVIVLVLVSAVVYFGGNFLTVQFHQYRMKAAYRAAHKLGPAEPKRERLMASYERHRSALMELGYYTKTQFYFQRLCANSGEYREMQRRLPEQFPYAIAKIEAHGYIFGEPPFIVVWLHPADQKLVEQFVAAQDAGR